MAYSVGYPICGRLPQSLKVAFPIVYQLQENASARLITQRSQIGCSRGTAPAGDWPLTAESWQSATPAAKNNQEGIALGPKSTSDSLFTNGSTQFCGACELVIIAGTALADG